MDIQPSSKRHGQDALKGSRLKTDRGMRVLAVPLAVFFLKGCEMAGKAVTTRDVYYSLSVDGESFGPFGDWSEAVDDFRSRTSTTTTTDVTIYLKTVTKTESVFTEETSVRVWPTK